MYFYYNKRIKLYIFEGATGKEGIYQTYSCENVRLEFHFASKRGESENGTNPEEAEMTLKWGKNFES